MRAEDVNMLMEFLQYFLPALGMLAVITFAVGLILSIAGRLDRRRVE